MVQEWQYEEKDRPQHSIDEFGRIRMLGDEPVENLVTWVYEEGSYVPVAKLQNGERYTIISDYMGRPVEAYNSYGNVVWQADYDIYGDLRNIKGIRDFIPFRQLGQYEDDETRLYYNRFRYYDPRIGNYISQDPIRLAGNNPTLYGYVGDCNKWFDLFGLDCKANKKQGTLAEDKIYNDLLQNPDVIVLGRQVYIQTPGIGRGRYSDILIQSKKTGKIINVEIKSGGAVRSTSQIKKDILINSGGGVFGKNAPLDMNGNPLADMPTSNVTSSVRNVPLWEINMSRIWKRKML